MSSFQSVVRFDLGFGVVGEIRLGYPVRAQSGTINSVDPTQNVIGRVFTQDPTTGYWSAGNVSGNGVFPSILSLPKDYATSGSAAGTLAPTLTLPNNTVGELIASGFITVALLSSGNPSLGDDLHYQNADGQILAVPAGTAPATGHSLLQKNGVYMYPQPNANGICIAALTNA